MTGARILALAALLAPSDPPPLRPLPVSSPKEACVQPSVAVDGKGGVHVAFASGGGILVASCPPGRREFATRPGPPARDFACGMRRGPRLAACGDALVVSWIEARFDAKRKVMIGSRDLLTSRSFDGGGTWSAPAAVNRRKAACGEGLHAMAAGARKDLYAAWLQAREEGKPGTVIRLARSEDAGATWAGETTVYESPSGTVCECCHPSVAVAPDGTVAVLFRNSLEGARDLYVAVSMDHGKTFAPAKKQGAGTWPLKGCPMDGGGIAFGKGNALLTAWRRERTVFLAGGAEEEAAGPGEQPWIGGIPGGASFAAWTDADGSLVVTDLGVPQRTLRRLPWEGERFSYPVVAGSASGVVFAAWERVTRNPAGTRIEGTFLLGGPAEK